MVAPLFPNPNTMKQFNLSYLYQQVKANGMMRLRTLSAKDVAALKSKGLKAVSIAEGKKAGVWVYDPSLRVPNSIMQNGQKL